MERVFIGLGSNIEPRFDYLEKAYLEMEEGIEIQKVSSIYQTEPVGFTEQDPFLNAVLGGMTSLCPYELLSFLQGIEASLNRRREVHWGPRTIDLDILLYGDRLIDTPQLKVPHPYMKERAFVLVPLFQIERGPILMGRTAGQLLEEIEYHDGVVVEWGTFKKKG